MKFSLSKILLLLIVVFGPLSVIGQFSFVEGSSITGATVTVNYAPESSGSGQLIINNGLEFDVSADFGEITNSHLGMGEVYIEYEVSYTYQGITIDQSGILSVLPDQLKDSRKYVTQNFDQSDNVSIKVISITLGSGTTVIPDNLRLSLDVSANYNYGLFSSLTNNTSNITDPQVSANTLGGQKLLLEWAVNSGAGYFEEFELQVMKVEPQYGQSSSSFIKDWNKALKIRIKGGGNSYEFMPSEGAGYYVWRVRGIGSEYSGGSTVYKNFGDWINAGGYANISSFYSASVDDASSYKLISNTTGGGYNAYSSVVSDNEFFVSEANSFEIEKNWSYMQQFAEAGKRKEVVTYANGLNQVKQTQTLINSTNQVVANATLYDYEGRAAVNTMMAPIGSSVFDYDENFILNSSGTPYTAADFDQDNNMWSPSEVHNNSSLSAYYGESNTESMEGFFVANGDNKTFTRNVFTPDATGRVWVQGGVGSVLQISNPSTPASNRNTVVEYAGVAQDELDYIFGNEAPLAENVYKTSTKDPNGVLSINYMTKKGEVLATLLDGSKVSDYSERLDPVDGFNTLTINDNLATANVSSDLMSTYSTKSLMVMGSGTFDGQNADEVNFGYSFTGSEFAQACSTTTVCPDCDYKIYLTITNAKYPSDYSRNIRIEMDIEPKDFNTDDCGGVAVTGTNLLSGTVSGVTLRAIDYTNTSTRGDVLSNIDNFLAGIVTGGQVYLKPGVYTIEKSVVINDLEETTSGTTYLDYYLDKLESESEDWDADENCCGVYTPTIEWDCDDETIYGCTDVSEKTVLIDRLWYFINKEQNTILSSNGLDYKDALSSTGTDLLSDGIVNTGSPTASYSMINSWMGCDPITTTGVSYGVISQCIELYGNILENNISLAESMATGTLQNIGTGAGAFNPDFDFLLNVVGCLGVSQSGTNSSYTPCSKWIDIYDFGSNGSGLSPTGLQSNEGYIVTFDFITTSGKSKTDVENDLIALGFSSSEVKVIEIYHPNYYVQGSNEFNHSASTTEKVIQGANDNCVKYLTYPSSLANSGNAAEDKALLAEMACNCLENIPTEVDVTENFEAAAISKDLIMECEELCDANRVIYEVAYNNEVLAQNILINETSDIYSPEWDEDILEVEKDCQIDLMVSSCKQKCHKPLHTFLADMAVIDISSGSINSFEITEISLDPAVTGYVDLTTVYSYAGVQNQLAQERQDLEDIFTGVAHYAPVGSYTTIDYQSVVKEEIIEFFNEELETGLSNRSAAVSYDPDYVLKSTFSAITANINTSNIYMNVTTGVFELLDEFNEMKSVTAQTTVIFDNGGTSEILLDDIILEVNVRLFCDEPVSPLLWWAVGPSSEAELESCGIFYGFSPAGYNIPYHIVDFSFDQYDKLHAIASENFCWASSSSWFEYLNVTDQEYISSVNIDMSNSSYSVGSNFWLRHVIGTSSSPIMDNVITLSGTTVSERVDQVVAEINNTSSTPICRAEENGNMVKLLFYDDESIDYSSNTVSILEQVSGIVVDIDEPLTSFVSLSECGTITPEVTVCPVGYDFIKGATSSASLMDLSDATLMQIQGNKVADFWIEGLETIVNSRVDILDAELLIPSSYTPFSSFSGDASVIETVETENYELWKTWNTPQGTLRAIIHVEAQLSTASHEVIDEPNPTIWMDATENRIISVQYKLEVLCEESETTVWVDLKMGKDYYTCLPGYTQYTGTLYENLDQNSLTIPSYVPYMFNDANRLALNSIEFDGNIFKFDVNDLMHTYLDDPSSFSAPYFVQNVGAAIDNEFVVVNGKVEVDSSVEEGIAFDPKITCETEVLNCDVCMRYTFEVDKTVLDPVVPISCEEMRAQMEADAVAEFLAACLEEKKEEIRTAYKGCISGYTDDLNFTYPIKTGQYTLYYYDRSGNLIQTVPPAGVSLLSSGDVTSVKTYRSGSGSAVFPSHSLVTKYRYNSLKQLVWQSTPDGGESEFGYNDLGQLILSQNAQQASDEKYSYSSYDKLGRIIEVGQSDAPSSGLTFAAVLELAKVDLSWISHTEDVTTTEYGSERNSSVSIPNQLGGSLTVVLENVRNRVLKTNNTEQTTYYSYDMHGNVKKLIHDINEIGIKVLEYEYDLVSGNVNQVKYNPHTTDGSEDQFMHKYEYDSDNRITKVYTSKDGVIWDRDAAYEYYLHGPLSRVELGQDEIQGIDYVYTLQGFLKSVNSVDLDKNGQYDKGADGAPVATITINSVSTVNNPEISILGVSNTYTIGSNIYDSSTPKGYAYAFASAINSEYDVAGSVEYRLKAEVVNDTEIKLYATGESTLPTGFSISVSNVSISTTSFTYNSTATDGFAMELGYFNGDYGRESAHVGMNSIYDPYQSTNAGLGSANELYNGNISTWLTNTYTDDLVVDAYGIKMNVYRYDALNRLLESDFHFWDNDYKSDDNRYDESFSYDANGNIKNVTRNGLDNDLVDDLEYSYYGGTNQLENVEDLGSILPTDRNDYHIGDQDALNYVYDKNGNMISDEYGKIKTIAWNVMGKIKSVEITNEKIINFGYDGMGNRIWKETLDSDEALIDKQYYVRDASGNVMAIYKKYIDTDLKLDLTEVPMYGSDRLGVKKLNQNIASVSSYTGDNPSLSTSETQTVFDESALDVLASNRTVGLKSYELKDHLGNVRSVVTDRKLKEESRTYLEFDGNNRFRIIGPNTANFSSNISIEMWVKPTDFTEKRMLLIMSKWKEGWLTTRTNGTLELTFGNNAGEHQTSRSTSSLIAGEWNHIVVVKDASNQMVSFYINGVLSNTVSTTIQASASAVGSYSFGYSTSYKHLGGVDDLRIWSKALTLAEVQSNMNTELTGSESDLLMCYDFNNISGQTITDLSPYGLDGTMGYYSTVETLDPTVVNQGTYYTPEIISITDYYAFGSQMPNRSASSDAYRYGFNGMEKDDEVKGNGNSYSATFWQYDPRLGRRWNVDPIVKSHESPYAAFANNPIWFIDPSGADTTISGTVNAESEIMKAEGDPDFVPAGIKLASTAQVSATIVDGKFTSVSADVKEKEYESPVLWGISPEFTEVRNKTVIISEDGLSATISYDVQTQISDFEVLGQWMGTLGSDGTIQTNVITVTQSVEIVLTIGAITTSFDGSTFPESRYKASYNINTGDKMYKGTVSTTLKQSSYYKAVKAETFREGNHPQKYKGIMKY